MDIRYTSSDIHVEYYCNEDNFHPRILQQNNFLAHLPFHSQLKMEVNVKAGGHRWLDIL